MPTKKQIVETEPVEVQEEPKQESVKKQEYRKLIEKYKLYNPVKYDKKKAELEEKLNAME